MELLSLKDDCWTLEVEVLLLLTLGPSVKVAPSFFGAFIVRTPSLESAVDTRSMSAAGGNVNSL